MFFFSENVAKNDDLAGALTEYPRKIQNPGVIKTRVKRGVLEDENISFLNFFQRPKTSQILRNFKAIHLWKKNFVPSFFSLLYFFGIWEDQIEQKIYAWKTKSDPATPETP